MTSAKAVVQVADAERNIAPPSRSAPAPVARAPQQDAFPDFPASWYYLCTSAELGTAPISRTLFGRQLVAWRGSGGEPVVMHGVCSHFGADLSQGVVRNGRLQCPFHHWEFGPGGRCEFAPAGYQANLPAARQQVWPTIERHGFIFVFHGKEALFEMPFFSECSAQDLLPAKPFVTELNCPWFLVGANGFDVQHFRAAHDRRLIEDPLIETPAKFVRQATCKLEVCGDGWRDRLTRLFAGDRLTMTITDWCGNLLFVTASFRRTTSYGMVITEPLAAERVRIRVIVFLPRGSGASRIVDPPRRAIRRYFIVKFLAEDARRLNGMRYKPAGLTDADGVLIDYLRWVAQTSHGVPPEHYQPPRSEVSG